MTWSWRFVPDVDVSDAVPRQDTFTNQGDAESWIGLHWRGLSSVGVLSVALVSDGETVYEMSLADPEG